MVRLKLWQWLILSLPIVAIISFLMVAAGFQIHTWGINWIWALFTLIFLAWRYLLVKWTKPVVSQVEAVVAQVSQELELSAGQLVTNDTGNINQRIETVFQEILQTAQNDPPMWEDWQKFWQRCQDLVAAIAHIYYPEVKYPLLNIYIPQAYGLMRGTVDDLDTWMQKLSPALSQVSIGQAYQAYEVYQKLEPSARKFMRVWNLAQYFLNPAAAIAKRASQGFANQANQQLLINLSQLLREAALRNLCRQAAALYGKGVNMGISTVSAPAKLPPTQTLREIFTQAEPITKVEQKPVNILVVGRTGAGKSSLINTLFQAELAVVDTLPSTDKIQNYHWQTETGESLTLWDTPGYEQVQRADIGEQVRNYATNADLLLLVTPALDPALQIDVDFLGDIHRQIPDLPIITVVTQVDKLRPLREWQPPYDWQWGDKPKEVNIREATAYRSQILKDFTDIVLPVVTNDSQLGRRSWNIEDLSLSLMEAIAPAKQLRLARFLQDLEARTIATAKIIDHYTFQMTTTQGITTLLKSPILQFISTLTTGRPTLGALLVEQIPVENLPLVIGKLQMAYELFCLLDSDAKPLTFDLLSLWSILLNNSSIPEKNAWAFGQALVEYWTQGLSTEQLKQKFESSILP
ncbi:GTPase family protein [Calothrix sp. 336/3]|uniref:GTPase family protein n=1 Tax=Calothrix sp. 336/3 TaxID=1337936 RepID=UPI0004E2B75A|nr:GTPase [Calothrix sp. 336/3]AKG23801.1 GTPase [Calothrix sp. 336/3]